MLRHVFKPPAKKHLCLPETHCGKKNLHLLKMHSLCDKKVFTSAQKAFAVCQKRHLLTAEKNAHHKNIFKDAKVPVKIRFSYN